MQTHIDPEEKHGAKIIPNLLAKILIDLFEFLQVLLHILAKKKKVNLKKREKERKRERGERKEKREENLVVRVPEINS